MVILHSPTPPGDHGQIDLPFPLEERRHRVAIARQDRHSGPIHCRVAGERHAHADRPRVPFFDRQFKPGRLSIDLFRGDIAIVTRGCPTPKRLNRLWFPDQSSLSAAKRCPTRIRT